jgi:hypothetical protein
MDSKQKVGTQLEPELLRRAKRRALEESRSLSSLIGEALEVYLSSQLPEIAERESALRAFCRQPIRLTPKQRQAVLEEDAWDA